MKITKINFAFLFCLLSAGCTSTTSQTSVAPTPPDPSESIHTFIRKIHLDHGVQIKAEQWNEIEQGPLGMRSTESIQLGRPIPSGIQLNELLTANARRGNSRNRYQNSARPRRNAELQREVKRSWRAVEVNSPKYTFPVKELNKIESEIAGYCRVSESGLLISIPLNAGESDTEIIRPLNISDTTRNAQLRMVCISGDAPPYRSPFIVDLYFELKKNHRLRVHYSPTVLDEESEQRLMKEFKFAILSNTE